MIGIAERTREDIPMIFPPFYPRCRHVVIRNGIPCCGLYHDLWRCNRYCPHTEPTPMRFPGRQVFIGIVQC